MHPIRTVEANFTFIGGSPDVADLPGTIDQEVGTFTATFALTDEERRQVAAGGKVHLTICAIPIPPIAIGITDLAESPGVEENGVPVHPDYRCRGCNALYILRRAIELEFVCGHCHGPLRLPGAPE